MSEAEASAVHGWGCTPTGDAPNTAKPRLIPATIVRGWQRNTLYAILVILMLLVFINIALTFWIMTSLRLSMKGIGPIQILNGGIQVEGHSFVTGRLVASAVTSRPGQPITLHSHRNFSLLVNNPEEKEVSGITIKRDRIVCRGRSFEVADAQGNSVFKASRDEVRVFAESLAVDGAGGVTVKSAVQTPAVRAPPGSDLQLESQTRRLDLRAPQSIYFESRAGSIDISSHGHIKLDSIVGAIKIEASNIYMPKLKEATRLPVSDFKSKSVRPVKVFQVCVCASGKVFLAAPDGLCAVHGDDAELCR